MQLSHDDVRDLAGGYVLGALDPAEEAAVREHLRTCDKAHPEFDELGGVVPYLAESGEFDLVEPPAALRGRIMAAAAAESRPAAERPAAPIPFPTSSERATRRGSPAPLDWALRIAAVVAIVALAGWNVLLQQDLGRAREYDSAVASVVEAAGQPGSQTVILTPAEGASARGIAAIRDDGSVVLALRDLAATSGPEVYETWFIVGDGAPVPVGSFTVGADGAGTFSTQPADAPPGTIVALTLEPNAGNTAPMGPVVASGVAIAPTS
jgi:anti-sigma-K factor RskA